MSVSLDLRKAHKFQRHGDLIVVLTWVNDNRCLVLLPALRRDAGWYIVDESAAFLWGLDHSDPSTIAAARDHTWKQSVIACDILGLEPNTPNRVRVISTITGWIPDLYRMPSAPEAEMSRQTYGEVKVMADGKLVAGEAIREEVGGGATYG